MIYLFEQYGYKRNGFYDGLLDDQFNKLSCIKGVGFKRHVLRKDKQELCLYIDFDEEKDKYHFQTSYFVGVDWIVESVLPIYVQPKLNKDSREVDYMRMLLEALQEPENLNHLDDLVHIDFHRQYIPIKQKQDMLSPFLIAQFLQLLKRIVQKGLKKSYYTVTGNLNSRVKGKILVGKNIKQNLLKGKQTHTICRYQEFGINCDENKILKKAYRFSRHVIQCYKDGLNTQALHQLINYIHPAFENVSEEIDIQKIKTFKSNPLFREYNQAIKLALLILKRYSYNITTTEQQTIMTPPFWIDMSKLFELYVFKKLREIFPGKDEVIYHFTDHRLEPDFLIDSSKKDIQMVVDAKYKPQYHDKSIELDDCRQVSGYARLKSVYDKLCICDYNRNIDCLIIYSNQELTLPEGIDLIQKESVQRYVNFYKLGIRLPEKKNE